MADRWDRDRFERDRIYRGGRDDTYYEDDLGPRRDYDDTSTKDHRLLEPSLNSDPFRDGSPTRPARKHDRLDLPHRGREQEQSFPRKSPSRPSSLDTFDRQPFRSVRNFDEEGGSYREDISLLEEGSRSGRSLSIQLSEYERQSRRLKRIRDAVGQHGRLGVVSRSEDLGDDFAHASHAGSSDSGYGSHANTSQAPKAHRTATDPIHKGGLGRNAAINSTALVQSARRKIYIREFTQLLSDGVLPVLSLTGALKPSLSMLDLWHLLDSFARRLYAEFPSKTERALAVFLSKNSSSISTSLYSTASQNRLELSKSGLKDVNERDVDSPLNQRDQDLANRIESIYLGDLHIDAQTTTDVEELQPLLKASAAYKWLTSMIRRFCEITFPGPVNPMAGIYGFIAESLLPRAAKLEVGSREAPPIIKMGISIDWDLKSFIRMQEYGVRPEDILNHVICLTGSWKACYAATPLDYLRENWPETYMPLYGLMKEFLALGSGGCDYETSNGHSLHCEQQEARFLVVIRGPLDFVIEITQQLAWLACALRPSPAPQGVMACRPVFDRTTDQDAKSEETGSLSYDPAASCDMDFRFVKPRAKQPQDGTGPDLSPPAGFCWSNMFRSPVLASGFPIPRRTETGIETGLEISLASMSLLMNSDSIFRCGESVIIKGFCCLLIAVEATKDMVIWHLLFNPSGDRISFFDTRLGSISKKVPQDLALKDLEAKRHVVGWCGDVTEYTGHPNANWAISPSYLPEAPSSFVLEKAYIEGGAQLLGGLIGSLGVRDKPAHLRREGSYFSLLDSISTQAIVFCGAEDRRAWLVDGASALLHLTRASIEQDRHKPVYRLNWRFDAPLEGDETPGGGAVAAIKILCSPQNLHRPLYIDLKPSDTGQMEEVQYTFYHRVKEIMSNLELLIDHQTQVSSQDGYWFRQSGKIINKSIMGFDFWDIAKPRGLVRPRAYYLPWTTIGHGWIEYIRSIKATTIFGTGFGDLLKSTNPTDLCSSWQTIPTGLDYLATSILSLKAIHASQTNSGLSPGDATSKIAWSSRSEPFSRCWCAPTGALAPASTTANSRSHLDPVQMLLPKGATFHLYVSETPRNITLGDLSDTGAVVFGHTMLLRDRLKLSSSHDTTSQGRSSATDSRDDSSHTRSLSTTGATASSISTSTSAGPDPSASQSSDPDAARTSPAPPSPMAGSSSALAVAGNPRAARLGKKAFWKRLSILQSKK